MPAEIDTGGPRVLHCDYRADCPIPIVVSLSSSVVTDSPRPRKDRIVVPVKRSHVARRLPGIDENESLVNGDGPAVESRSATLFALPARRRGGTPTRCHGSRGFRRTSSIDACIATNVPNDDADGRREEYPDKDYSVPDVCRPESRLSGSAANCEINATRGEKRSRGTRPLIRDSSIVGYRQIEGSPDHDIAVERLRSTESSDVSVRDRSAFDAAGTTRLTGTGKSSLFSSHRSRGLAESEIYGDGVSGVESCARNTTWEEIVDVTSSWRREPRVGQVVESADRRRGEFPRFDENPRVNAPNSRNERKRNACSNSPSSYFRLVFLFILVAFGQSGLLKSSVLNCCARASTTGLSVLAIGTVISAVSAAPVDLMGDAGVRAERSANLSHITGASRKIQMYIKNRHLQILPDGTVNGSNDDTSDYTIFQRTSVSRGQLRIQGVATCLYLCMDSCGLLYGSREYTEDCVFNETLEQHNYNTYSSVRWSTAKKTLYLGLNRRGQPRRVQAKGHNLGRLSAYARVLTQVAPAERVEALQRRMMGAHHNVRHRHNGHGQRHHRGDAIQQPLCPTLPAQEKDGRDRFRCRKRKKRKKRKRRCRPGEKPGPQCQIPEDPYDSASSPAFLPAIGEDEPTNGTSPESKRSCEGEASGEACRREALSVPSKKRKLRVEEPTGGGPAGGVRNVTSNGKNKPPASNAKKVSIAGSMSQSKKPNLTDGKKRKRKGPPARRNPRLPPLARKRFPPGRADNTSAVPTATTAPISAMSSSSWWSPGASIGPSGRGASPRRRTKAPSDAVGTANNNPHPRRVGKTLAKNRAKSIGRDATTTASGYEPTTTVLPDLQTSRSPDIKVPRTVVPDRSSLGSSGPSSLESIDSTEDDAARSLSDTSSSYEDPSSTVSGERTGTTLDSTLATSLEATTAPTIFRLIEEEGRSIEDTDGGGDDDADADTDAGRLDASSTTPQLSLERLAM